MYKHYIILKMKLIMHKSKGQCSNLKVVFIIHIHVVLYTSIIYKYVYRNSMSLCFTSNCFVDVEFNLEFNLQVKLVSFSN